MRGRAVQGAAAADMRPVWNDTDKKETQDGDKKTHPEGKGAHKSVV